MGDPAGIGPEVIIKSLASSEVKSACTPIIVGSPSVMSKAAELLRSQVQMMVADTFEELDSQGATIPVLDCIGSSVEKVKIGRASEASGVAAARAIKRAVELASGGAVNAIVTGPVSKHALHLAGYNYPGQTEFLADLTGASEVVMMLVSEKLRVALVTTHCSISDVAAGITKETIVKKMTILNTWLPVYFEVSRPRIAVCALNPHAGDGGIFGREEIETIGPAIEEVKGMGIDAVGPVPADALFAQSRVKPYDAYLAMYHDQGLVPLKMGAFGEGVNVTLGLPIVRTSPDHGTAFDLAGKGVADPASMIEAVKLAARMAKRKPQNRLIGTLFSISWFPTGEFSHKIY